MSLALRIVISSNQKRMDFIIREAQNKENLALMYEGWTAWIRFKCWLFSEQVTYFCQTVNFSNFDDTGSAVLI